MVKHISAVYKTVGKRRKLVGFVAEVDGYSLGIVFDTREDAQAAADAAVYDRLAKANRNH